MSIQVTKGMVMVSTTMIRPVARAGKAEAHIERVERNEGRDRRLGDGEQH